MLLLSRWLLLISLLLTLRCSGVRTLSWTELRETADEPRRPDRSVEQLTAIRDSFRQLQNELTLTTLQDDDAPPPNFEYEVDDGRARPLRHRHAAHWKRTQPHNWQPPQALPLLDADDDDWGTDIAKSVRAGLRTVAAAVDATTPAEAGVQRYDGDSRDTRGFLRAAASQPNRHTVCPRLHGKERIVCPGRGRGRYHVCIFAEQLCNGRRDCPLGEDEQPTNCLFYKTTMAHFKKVVDAVVSLTDHMVSAEQRRHAEL